MSWKKSCIALVLVLLLIPLMGATVSRGRRVPRPQIAPKVVDGNDPFKHETVLVEAFVVDADMSVLYDMGVDPLGRGSQGVCARHIQQYITREGPEAVIAAIRVAVRQGESAVVNESRRIPLLQEESNSERVRNSPRYAEIELEKTLDADVAIVSDQRVRLEYALSLNSSHLPKVTRNEPEGFRSWSWSGAASLTFDEPRIVASTQHGSQATFLLLVVHPGKNR